MFGRVLSALFSFAGWFVQSTLVKFGLFFGLYFVTTEFITILIPKLPGATNLLQAFASQSAGVWYFISIFKLPLGVSLCISAYCTRFIIRRIPLIG